MAPDQRSVFCCHFLMDNFGFSGNFWGVILGEKNIYINGLRHPEGRHYASIRKSENKVLALVYKIQCNRGVIYFFTPLFCTQNLRSQNYFFLFCAEKTINKG